jgi:hypothetical protein
MLRATWLSLSKKQLLPEEKTGKGPLRGLMNAVSLRL